MMSRFLYILSALSLAHLATCQFSSSMFGPSPFNSFGQSSGLSCSKSQYGPNGFPVSCRSPLQGAGLTITSENKIEGTVGVSGQLPFLATIGIEGEAPTNGQSNVCYTCGDGEIGIVSDNSPNQGLGSGFGFGSGFGGVFGPALGGSNGFPLNGV